MTQGNDKPICDLHELLVTYLYDEATREEAVRFKAHLLECAACRQELSAFENVRQSLQQWQLEQVPSLHLRHSEADQPRRSFLEVLKELFTVMPLWVKGMGALATAMLVLAVLGTDLSIGKDGFSLHADVLRKDRTVATVQPGNNEAGTAQVRLNDKQVEVLRQEFMTKVSDMIKDSTLRQQEDVRAQLIAFQSQLKGMNSGEISRIAARVQQHHIKLQAIERDIDRNEGLGLSDILFSEAGARRSSAKPDSD